MKLISKELLCVKQEWNPKLPPHTPFHPFSGIFGRGPDSGNTVFKTIKPKPFIVHTIFLMF